MLLEAHRENETNGPERLRGEGSQLLPNEPAKRRRVGGLGVARVGAAGLQRGVPLGESAPPHLSSIRLARRARAFVLHAHRSFGFLTRGTKSNP